MMAWTITLTIIGAGIFAIFRLKSGSTAKQSRITFWVLVSLIFISVAFVSTVVIVLSFQWRAPPEPEITYGEFPFRLEYEIDGERFVIEDVVIVEFMGSFRGNPTTRPWRS